MDGAKGEGERTPQISYIQAWIFISLFRFFTGWTGLHQLHQQQVHVCTFFSDILVHATEREVVDRASGEGEGVADQQLGDWVKDVDWVKDFEEEATPSPATSVPRPPLPDPSVVRPPPPPPATTEETINGIAHGYCKSRSP